MRGLAAEDDFRGDRAGTQRGEQDEQDQNRGRTRACASGHGVNDGPARIRKR